MVTSGIILGIDPGTTSIGYAAIERDRKPILREAGLIKITDQSAPARLKKLHYEILELIKKWKPEFMATERLFFAKNAKTAMAVSEARGVILLTSSLAGINVLEYTPLEVKKAVTGDGKADKIQVKKMVQLVLPETATLKAQDDVFDAIALALTGYYQSHFLSMKKVEK